MHKHLDLGTQLTLAITLGLFVIALFEKGFTHDLLLEAGVFLVSVKLVIMSYKANTNIATLDSQLITMTTSLQRIEQLLRPDPNSVTASPASTRDVGVASGNAVVQSPVR